MRKSCDFVIMLDALRHDYIDATRTPFLESLRVHSKFAKVIETYAFQTRPSYFAGLEPSDSGISYLFERNAAESPFSFTKLLAPIFRMFDPWGYSKIGRGIIRRIAKVKDRNLGNLASADVMSTAEIPIHLLSQFALAEKKYTDEPAIFSPHKTFFDRLREIDFDWNWIGYPRHFGSTSSILSHYKKAPQANITYLHFSELDWIGHKFGPNSPEISQALCEIDKMLEELLAEPLRNGSKLVLFGDHGMVATQYFIDLISPLKKIGYRPGKDYLVFIDSTQARFWFPNPKSKQSIEALLMATKGGHILFDQEQEKLGIAGHAEKFGELIFAIDGPGIFHPSFFDHSNSPPKGMHGYLPDIIDNQTFVMVTPNNGSKDLGTIPMTQIFQLLCDHLL